MLPEWYKPDVPNQLFRVTARRGFFVYGSVAPQSGLTYAPGGGTQILVPKVVPEDIPWPVWEPPTVLH